MIVGAVRGGTLDDGSGSAGNWSAASGSNTVPLGVRETTLESVGITEEQAEDDGPLNRALSSQDDPPANLEEKKCLNVNKH